VRRKGDREGMPGRNEGRKGWQDGREGWRIEGERDGKMEGAGVAWMEGGRERRYARKK